MTLAQTIEEGRSLETIAKHRRNLQRTEKIHRISRSKGECFRCGHSGHYANDEDCPARDKKCEKCHLVGHFKRCCKTKEAGSRKGKGKELEKRRKKKLRQVVTEDSYSNGSEEQDDDSDDESVNYVFATSSENINMAPCKVGGVRLDWMIDSGAGVNVISADVWEYLKNNNVKVEFQTAKVAKKLLTYGGHKLSVKGMFIAEISTKTPSISDRVYVVKEGGANLLGKTAATKLGILKIDTSICAVKQGEEKIGKVKGVVVTVQVNSQMKPIQQTQSRIPIPLQPKVERELEKLLQQDVIERAPRDSPWISRLVVRPKPGNANEIRLCVDMRDANKAIVPQHHPFPTFDDIIPHLHNCKFFSKIDLNKAFHRIELVRRKFSKTSSNGC